MLVSKKRAQPSISATTTQPCEREYNIMDLGWIPAKFSWPHSAFLTLHTVSYLAALMNLHSSNGPTPACEGLFCSLVDDLPSSRKQCWKKTQKKVFATLLFQGLCLPSLLEHTNYFWLAISEKIHRKHLSAGLQMILLLLQKGLEHLK